ncbi:hypothetical protein NESM_000826600 [Novymonas esmeraldas]|uniref:Ribosome biogenesis protein NOP53 n=1 Tax=Novymonas esmeraldas TaxID=1808958 RepID=A0AAW0EYL5_9TRYP
MPAKRVAVKRAAAEALPTRDVADALPTPTSAAAAAAEVVVDAPVVVVMSKAQRRRLKKPPVIVTAAMKERAREETRELRKYMRMIKSNGGRRKLAKLREKRSRETDSNEEAVNALDTDYRPHKRGRRLE